MRTKTRERRQINIETVNVESLGYMTKDKLLAEAEECDRTSPLDDLEEKELLLPDYRSESMTIRLTPVEKKLIRKLAIENGISKSAMVRMLLKRSLREVTGM